MTIAKPFLKEIALPLIARGFTIAATKPEPEGDGKIGAPRWNGQNRIYNAENIHRFLKANPSYVNSNVIVIGSCGFFRHSATGELTGRLCMLDIDSAGVVEQIERETREKIPSTYTVCSRGKDSPKRHFYFRHTRCSQAMSRRLGNGVIKEVWPSIRHIDGRRDYRGLTDVRYDLKGFGNGGAVVGVGSVHYDTGEVYVCINEADPVPIPDWLIDWLEQDVKAYRSFIKEQQRAELKRAECVRKLSPKKQKELQEKDDQRGFLISKEKTYAFLKAKAKFFGTQGPSRETLRLFLIDRAVDACHGGKEYIESEDGMKALDRIVSATVIKNDESFLSKLSLDAEDEIDIHNLDVPMSQQATIVLLAEDFPLELSSTELYYRLESELTARGCSVLRGTDGNFKDTFRNAVSKAMKVAGYKNTKRGGISKWRKLDTKAQFGNIANLANFTTSTANI